LAIVAFAGFQYTGNNLKERKPIIDISDKTLDEKNATLKNRTPSLRLFVNQLLRWKNFWLFVFINLIQVFNCHFNSNFLTVFMEHLVGNSISPFMQSVVLSLASMLPHAFVVLIAPYIPRKGKATRYSVDNEPQCDLLAYIL
jgi:hypothetical protein